MNYEFDSNESWLPECNGIYPAIREREPEGLTTVRPRRRYDFDGHVFPKRHCKPRTQTIHNPSSGQITENYASSFTRHPVTPAFLRSTFNEARRLHGTVKSIAVFVMHGLGDSQSIRVLISMGFRKDEERETGQGVCYVGT